MEKLEYKGRIEEMKNLVTQKKFADAISVAETINWRKVHNINDILAGSDSYDAAGYSEEARDLLLLAHERSPIGRMILYKLCMISIKLKDLESAQEYYNEFVQIAPHDSLKYILKYNINVAKGSDNTTLIKILEQLKENDFIEEWAYELAYLYHKTNQADKCIELCDEIILWFGDGPVVERALELKMLYQPLDKNQETKYRHIQQKKDGITEITAGEQLESGEIIPHTVAIPSIELPSGPERFNTISLQAEIKKSIDEIMKATEAEEVSENIDNIKNLVEEIPYLQVKEDAPVEPEEQFSVNDTFQQYLAEGYDGQISLMLPDDEPSGEEQVEGQMTIEDVLAEWEKTKRAAEAAMEDAKTNELESARAKALREANNVLNRLEGAMSKLDAGMTSAELLKEEYLAGEDEMPQPEYTLEYEDDEPEVQSEIDKELEEETDTDDIQVQENSEETGFAIPKLNIEGAQLGSVDIPIVHSTAGTGVAAGIVAGAATTSWMPPTLEKKEENEDVDFKEASQMIADVNKMLQLEIDRLTSEPEEEEKNSDSSQIELGVNPFENLSDEMLEEPIESKEQKAESLQEQFEEKIDQPIINPVEFTQDIELPKIELPPDLFNEEETLSEEFMDESIPVEQVALAEEYEPEQQFDPSLPIIDEGVIEPDELAQLVDENVLAKAIEDDVKAFELDEADLATFSYFIPINGMKNSITQVLMGAAEHIANPSSNGGNIVIVGEQGSGKTQMATSIIRVLKKKTDKPSGGIGKISGEKLNEKDIQKLYAKIQGGCLIVESAGNISKETAVTLSLLMEQDESGTIIILEDNKRGIEKALSRDSSFAKRFTEKIIIPIFSIDELVSFARTYAEEAGCCIDDMGVLALYNRINLIGRYDHVTTIKEVAEIMDEAIENSTRGGFFNKPKYDKFGNVILKEKDFDK